MTDPYVWKLLKELRFGNDKTCGILKRGVISEKTE